MAVLRSNVLMNAEFVNSREHFVHDSHVAEAGWKTSWRRIAWEIASQHLQDVDLNEIQ